MLSPHHTHFEFGCAAAYKTGNWLKTSFRHCVMAPSNHFWILSSQFKPKKKNKECLRGIKTGQQLRGQRVPGCLRCLFCRSEEQSLLSQDGGYLNEACTSSWRQHSTDLILRLVPVFQIPVPQDHLKYKEQTSNVIWMQSLCAFAHAEMHFTWKEHRSCFWSASGFSPRALPGQTLAATARPCCYLDTHCSNSWLWGFPGLYDASATTGMHAASAVADRGLWLTGKRRKESHWNGRSVSTMGLWALIWQQLRQSAAFPRCLLVTRQQLSRLTATYGRGCVTLEFLKQPSLSARATHVTGDDHWG